MVIQKKLYIKLERCGGKFGTMTIQNGQESKCLIWQGDKMDISGHTGLNKFQKTIICCTVVRM